MNIKITVILLLLLGIFTYGFDNKLKLMNQMNFKANLGFQSIDSYSKNFMKLGIETWYNGNK